MRRRIRSPLVLALAVSLGAALLLAGNVLTMSARQTSGIDSSKSVAKRFIAAATALNEKRIASLYTPKAVQVDETNGVTANGRDGIASSWTDAFHISGIRFHGTLTCAGPGWAVVNWVFKSPSALYQGGTLRSPGISILEIKNGLIAHESMYYERIEVR